MPTLPGHTEQAFTHLQAVTGMTRSEAMQHVHNAEVLWLIRSRRTWVLDLGVLTNADVTLREPEAAHERPAAARHGLQQAIT